MKPVSRRIWLGQIGTLAAVAALPRSLSAQGESEPQPRATSQEQAAMAEIARQFMAKYHVPGLSVAIGRRGDLVYQQGFGYADTASHERVTPDHVFRIASVSKPVTSAAIFTLIERGKLNLDDQVFGEDGLLRADNDATLPALVKLITVHHLLTHTAGGWGNDAHDPMFAQSLMDQRRLIDWTLRTQPLQHPPGTNYQYSNFGYCVLGRVVEKITGQSYETWVRENILQRCGSATMSIAGNRLSERKPGEVVYYAGDRGMPYGMNVRRMDSHGGWLAAPRDLVRFAERVDGFAVPPDILKPETLGRMLTPSAANPQYACGWSINSANNWWHAGSLPGTSSVLVRTHSGLCWSGIINTRTEGVGLALDQLIWKLAQCVPAWRA